VARRPLLVALALLASAGLSPAAVRPPLAANPRMFAAGRDAPLVFAAASLSDALRGIADAFEARTGRSVTLAFGGSGDLARQIQAGAPAAVFVSADARSVESLERAGLVKPTERIDLLSNRLVVVVPESATHAPRTVRELASLSSLAIADPATAPVGIYAREWLTRAGVWAALEERIVPTLDVRAALAAVESASAPAAVVYRTDALLSRRVRVAFEAAPHQAPRIVYVAALIAGAGERGREFFRELRSAQARAVFERLGFELLGGP